MIGSGAGGPAATFDYEELGSAGPTVRRRADRIRHHLRAAAERAVTVGRELIAAKDDLGHGRFGRWLRAEFDWSESTAQRYMQVAREFPESPHGAGFALRAMLILCGSAVPEAGCREATERAAAWEKITPAVAREIRRRHSEDAGPVGPVGADGVAGHGQLADVSQVEKADPGGELEDVENVPAPRQKAPMPDPAGPISSGGKPEGTPSPGGSVAGHTASDPGPADLSHALESFLALVPAPATPERNQFARMLRLHPHDRRKELAAVLDRAEKTMAYIRSHLSGTLNRRRRPRRGV